MRLVLSIIFLLCAIDAFAAEPAGPIAGKPKSKKEVIKRNPTRGIFAGGIAAVGEKSNDNRNFEPRGLLFLKGGIVHLSQHELLVEIGAFKQNTGTSGVEISRMHQQIDLWYHFLFYPLEPIGHPFIGAALGAQRDEVTTSFFGQSDKAIGAFEAQLSVAGGYRFNLGENGALWLEGRLASSNNYVPRVLPAAAISIGFVL